MIDIQYETYRGRGPQRIAHFEHWSCPDAETYLTGIDYYDHPRLCRQKLKELYPFLELGIPESDTPRTRPRLGLGESNAENHTVRWGEGETGTWLHGEAIFHSAEEVLRFSPLGKADFSDWPHVVENADFSSEEVIFRRYRARYPAEWGDAAPAGIVSGASFYNTLFMWPLLTFGWELFLEVCLLDEFERVMDEFAEINRRVFRAIARLPVNIVVSHDDIVTSRGPVCSPQWMRRNIFPHYEELWGILRDAGKQVVFMCDGNLDAYVDDVMACGASGFVTEPYTDFKAIARRYPNVVLAGEGDNRVLTRNDPAEIRSMVDSMLETAKMSGGYFFCIGNHVPWNVTPQGIERYLNLSAELGFR